MTPRPTDCKPEGYWEQIATDGSGDGETILDAIQESGPEWDVIAVDIADQSDSSLFLLVIRRRVSDAGNLILSERYYRYDLDDREGSYLGNGIERRVTGTMGAALRVLYSAAANGDLGPDDPMLMDSRSSDGIDYTTDELTTPLDDGSDETDEEIEEVEVSSAVADEEIDKAGWVRCRRCGEAVHEDDAVKYGKGDLGEFWIHDGGCPEADQ